MADLARMWPLPIVPTEVVHVQVAKVEGLATGLTGEVLFWAVDLLVCSQGAVGSEGFKASLAAERFEP